MNLKNVENLVLAGGGIRSLAFLGAIEYLEENGTIEKIKRVVGSSAGCIYATAIACKIKSTIMKDIIKAKNFSTLKDDTWGFVIDVARVINYYGMCKGDALYDWFGELLKSFVGSADITFQELYDKDKP